MGKLMTTTYFSPWQEGTYHTAETCHADLVMGESRQAIHGFGGCFNELGYAALQQLREKERTAAMKALFTPSGCDLRYCRMPIGANDFALEWYSLNENRGDYGMEHFSTARDEHCLIPYIREAKALQPDLTVFASPWSPPTWMKHPAAYNFGTLIWKEENLRAYAEYFVRFVKAMRAAGVPLNAVHVQNEPMSDQKFPSCVWTGEQLRDFIRDYLGPRMKADCPETTLWLGTLNGPFNDYGGDDWMKNNFNRIAGTVLRDEKARSYIAGIAYQWGGKHSLYQTARTYPEIELIQSECECGDGQNSWGYMEYCFEMMWNYFENGVTAFTYWNMVLQDGGESTWGWHQNSLITVRDGKAVYNPEFYLFKHFGHYVKPGAVMKRLTGHACANALCFENTDGSIVLVYLNPFEETDNITVDTNGTAYRFDAKPRSLTTLVID